MAVCEIISKIIFNMPVYGLLRSQKAIFKSYIREENLRFACVVLSLSLVGLKSLNEEAVNNRCDEAGPPANVAAVASPKPVLPSLPVSGNYIEREARRKHVHQRDLLSKTVYIRVLSSFTV